MFLLVGQTLAHYVVGDEGRFLMIRRDPDARYVLTIVRGFRHILDERAPP